MNRTSLVVVVLPLLFLAPAQGISQPGETPKAADEIALKKQAKKAEKPEKKAKQAEKPEKEKVKQPEKIKEPKPQRKTKKVPVDQPPLPVTSQPPLDAEEDKRPVVYRYGRLPNGLPRWFTQLDRDRDGQIGLFEWKQRRLPIELFQRLDLNHDGFITPEELLRHLACGGDRAALFQLKVVPDSPPDDDDLDLGPS